MMFQTHFNEIPIWPNKIRKFTVFKSVSTNKRHHVDVGSCRGWKPWVVNLMLCSEVVNVPHGGSKGDRRTKNQGGGIVVISPVIFPVGIRIRKRLCAPARNSSHLPRCISECGASLEVLKDDFPCHIDPRGELLRPINFCFLSLFHASPSLDSEKWRN